MRTKKTHETTMPANVRYCNTIPAGARLLYSEIAFICETEGCCRRRNKDFSKLFEVDIITISRWIKNLREKGFIRCKYKKYLRIISLKNKWIVIWLRVNTSVTYIHKVYRTYFYTFLFYYFVVILILKMSNIEKLNWS